MPRSIMCKLLVAMMYDFEYRRLALLDFLDPGGETGITGKLRLLGDKKHSTISKKMVVDKRMTTAGAVVIMNAMKSARR